jgi:hypothetical protein
MTAGSAVYQAIAVESCKDPGSIKVEETKSIFQNNVLFTAIEIQRKRFDRYSHSIPSEFVQFR